jgi:hypothetical protein
MDLTASVHQILCKYWKKWNGDYGNDQTSIWGRKHDSKISAWMEKSKLTKTIKAKTCEEHAHHFHIKRIVYKEFVLTGQTVNSTYYLNILQWLHEMSKDFAPNFGDKRTDCYIMATNYFKLPFSPGNLWPKTKIMDASGTSHSVTYWRVL